jgi:two-component system cell cycle sensor histidine kinase/response regulator CckA
MFPPPTFVIRDPKYQCNLLTFPIDSCEVKSHSVARQSCFGFFVQVGDPNSHLMHIVKPVAGDAGLADERLRDLVSSLQAIVWEATIVHETDLMVTYISAGAASMLGYSDARWTEPHGGFTRSLHDDDRARVIAQCCSLTVARPTSAIEFRLASAEGRVLWFAGDIRLLDNGVGDRIGDDRMRDAASRHIRGVAVNVTERRRADEHDVATRRDLEEQLRQSQKMEAVGRLAAGVAHDFNNLLTLVSGYSEVLMAEAAEGSRAHKAADAVRKATDRATSLTQKLLAFSRRQVLRPRVLDLNDLIGSMTSLLQPLVREDIELVVQRGANVQRVKADPQQLEQVILNLAANARDAMPRGGSLRMAVDTFVLERAHGRRAGDLQPGRYVRLTIADTGDGMDPETQRRLFEPFFTTKAKGTGLGLASVYGIVVQSGGHISVTSEVGKGSTFTILLPEVKDQPDPVPVEQPPPPPPSEKPHGKEAVMLVEDEDAVRSLLRESLEAYGYTVLEARGGAEALAVAGWNNTPIDLLVTDLIMPQMNGRELADRLRADRPKLRVLFITGYTDRELTPAGSADLHAFLLRKPFTGREFARKVRDVLDTKV